MVLALAWRLQRRSHAACSLLPSHHSSWVVDLNRANALQVEAAVREAVEKWIESASGRRARPPHGRSSYARRWRSCEESLQLPAVSLRQLRLRQKPAMLRLTRDGHGAWGAVRCARALRESVVRQ